MRILIVCAVASALTTLTSGCQEQSKAAAVAPPPPIMTVAQPVKKEIVEWDAYTGRLEAVDFVEVRARVSGYLQSVHFREGQMVKEGDLLFVIDPRPFIAELNRAKAALRQAESLSHEAQAKLLEAKAVKAQSDAQLQLAYARVERARRLSQSNATSQEEVDQREAEYLQAQADIEAAKAGISSAEAAIATSEAAAESAQAGLEAAQLNLDYTRVTAPVNGRISEKFVTEGNLVGGGSSSSTLLTTITSMNPIYCSFNANEQEVLKYTRMSAADPNSNWRVARNPVFLGIVDEQGFPHEGHMDFVDNRFNEATATLTARAVFPNDKQVLVPGMFAKLRIPGSPVYEAILIPDSAIGTDQSDQYVYIVSNGVLERRAITTGPMVDGLRVIRTGLNGDESLVIQGMIRGRPGLEVETKDGTITVVDDGLPKHYEPLPPEKWIPTTREGSSSSTETPVQTTGPAPIDGGAAR